LAKDNFVVSHTSKILLRQWLQQATSVLAAVAAAPARPAAARRARRTRCGIGLHLLRKEVVHEPEHDGACTCPACGGAIARIGEDVSEVLDYIGAVPDDPACPADAITQAPAPALPMPRGRTAPGMFAHLLVSKYTDHVPLYRQSEIYARDGLDLDRSTLSDWVGQAVWLI
jgi:transposase